MDFPKLNKYIITQQKDTTIFVYEESLRAWEWCESTEPFRGQPNCFGIPVLWCFDRGDDGTNYFNDRHFGMYSIEIKRMVDEARAFKTNERQVYWIQPDIGKKYMSQACPELYEYLLKELGTLI